tara:strand:+ start:3369 stop:3545 length:177 start_codon:yes stop_codon:yes gene_type:complete
MAFKLKKKYEHKSLDTLNKPLNQLTQKEIKGIRKHFRDKFFEEVTTSKPKNVQTEGEI